MVVDTFVDIEIRSDHMRIGRTRLFYPGYIKILDPANLLSPQARFLQLADEVVNE